MAFSIRRIVTGHDDKGRAVVSMDSVIPSRAGRFDDGTHVQELWQTDSLPPRQDGPDAVATRTLAVEGRMIRSYDGGWADVLAKRAEELIPPPAPRPARTDGVPGGRTIRAVGRARLRNQQHLAEDRVGRHRVLRARGAADGDLEGRDHDPLAVAGLHTHQLFPLDRARLQGVKHDVGCHHFS